jgi:hypothetical protein
MQPCAVGQSSFPTVLSVVVSLCDQTTTTAATITSLSGDRLIEHSSYRFMSTAPILISQRSAILMPKYSQGTDS